MATVLEPGFGNQAEYWPTGRWWGVGGCGCGYGSEGLTAALYPARGAMPAKSGPNRGLFGVIRMRPSAFSGVRISVAMQVTGADRTQWTRIPSPENRKVGG